MLRINLFTSLFVSVALLSTASNAQNTNLPILSKEANDWTWTGIYAGLNAGAVKHTLNVTDNKATTFLATIEQTSNADFTGGLQVGYRKQLDFNRTSGVYGLELAADFANNKFHKNYGSPFALYQLKATNKYKGVGLFQFIGGIAADRTLLFLSAGISKTYISGNMVAARGIPFIEKANIGKNSIGTAIGGGIEYAIYNSFSARLKVDVITPELYTARTHTNAIFGISSNIVQGTIGVNYKFS